VLQLGTSIGCLELPVHNLLTVVSVSGQILDPQIISLPYPEKTRAMYSSEDLERFYVEYQSEWVPRGMTVTVPATPS